MLTMKDFDKQMRGIFSGNKSSNQPPEKRFMHAGVGFIQAVYDEYGTQGLIDFCDQVNVVTGEEGIDLIKKLTT